MTEEQIQHEDDLLIINDVARAIEEDELIAYLQPIVEVETGKVVSAEALVRWTMPDGTVVPAGLFVPSLDRTDTIFGLDWFMAENVCRFLETETAGTAARVPVALNISARHAKDPEFAKKLKATVGWHDMGDASIRVELPEAAVLGGGDAVACLVSSVRQAGFTVSVDNFASGEAELMELHARDIDVVKVARQVWAEDPSALAAILARAQELNMTLAAEGVETEGELAALKAAGMPYAQGYFFAQPMDGASFVAFCG